MLFGCPTPIVSHGQAGDKSVSVDHLQLYSTNKMMRIRKILIIKNATTVSCSWSSCPLSIHFIESLHILTCSVVAGSIHYLHSICERTVSIADNHSTLSTAFNSQMREGKYDQADGTDWVEAKISSHFSDCLMLFGVVNRCSLSTQTLSLASLSRTIPKECHVKELGHTKGLWLVSFLLRASLILINCHKKCANCNIPVKACLDISLSCSTQIYMVGAVVTETY